MRYTWLALVMLLACKKEPVTKPEEPAKTGPQPLRVHCGTSACRSYDEAVTQVRRYADGGPCLRGNVGKCGDLRWVEWSDGFSSFEELFDANGKMVAAKTWVDVQPEGTTYGDLPACTPVTSEKLCRD